MKRKTTIHPPINKAPFQGCFLSSPIHGNNEAEAMEILSRTYKPGHFWLRLSHKVESKLWGTLHYFWIASIGSVPKGFR